MLHQRAQDLCTGLGPISFGVSGVRWTNSYFTFLFLSLVDESSVLERAVSFFPRSDLPWVGPHLSLAYSDRYEDINRSEIAQAIAADMPKSILCTSLELVIPAGGEWGEIDNWLSYPVAEFDPPPGAPDAAWTAREKGARGAESAMVRGNRQ